MAASICRKPGNLMQQPHDKIHIFDRSLLRLRRARAAARFAHYDFLHREVGDRLLDRLEDLNRRFPVAVDLESRQGLLPALLQGRGHIETLISCDLTPEMLPKESPTTALLDPEFLPFREGSLDLVLSNLGLHWSNDLPGVLIQIRRALKPDGLLLASLLGGETLAELRQCLADAEIELFGGLSPRLSPVTDVRDAGALLQRAGFALPVVDSDKITVTYDNAFRLLEDVRGMAESNLVFERVKHFTPRALFLRMAALYQERYSGPDGRITATFSIINLTAWGPADSQQQPLKPGSGETSLTQLLGTEAPSFALRDDQL